MRIVGLMPVRNEAWVLGLSARVALKWCDDLIILDHASTDATPDIIEDVMNENTGRVWKHKIPDPQWDEMAHRQSMLEYARKIGATHIAIIDADEVLTGNLLRVHRLSDGTTGPHIRNFVQLMRPEHCMHLPGYNLRENLGALHRANSAIDAGLRTYHANGVWGKRWFSTVFQDDPRLSWEGNKFHSREPGGMPLHVHRPIAQGIGGVMHLWGASERRLISKHALYKIIERLRFPEKPSGEIDQMYSWAIKGDPDNSSFGTPATWSYENVPSEWWDIYRPLRQYLDVHAEPWQEAECVRLIKEHGPREFAGLDLFGVV